MGCVPRNGMPRGTVCTHENMNTTSRHSDLARDESEIIGGATRSALFKWCLGAAICWIAACVPPNERWQSQPGHQYQAPTAGHDDDGDGYDGTSPSEYGDGYDGASPSEYGGGHGGGGSSWTCEAMATFVGEGPIQVMGQGNTRDDAHFNAFSNCNSLMTVTSNFNEASERRTQVVSECTVTECNEWH
jgi:hypothetical protein